ncbi:MAG TPA: hypothetical protein VK694_08045 [Verrucomicrobiae bacterium]|nr:hypothetical protein [Verrucomicrobiae bacterium]
MTPEGYQQIVDALTEADIPAVVSPVPGEGESIPFVDVRTNQTTQFCDVVNALGKAGLAHSTSNRDLGLQEGPALSFVTSELRTVAGNNPRPPLQATARFTTFKDHSA